MSSRSNQQRLIQLLAERGIVDRRVLKAMAEVPRERFVPEDYRDQAFDDRALPIEAGQTISQPYMVALMTQELRLTGNERVLEIGTGSGYQAAVLAKLCAHVVTIERIAGLQAMAQDVLASLGFTNIEFHVGDGSCGWEARAPYDGIIVTAGAPEMPQTLYEQLRLGGRLVIPIGTGRPQVLQTIVKEKDGPQVTDVCECSFVPLIGEEGWPVDEV